MLPHLVIICVFSTSFIKLSDLKDDEHLVWPSIYHTSGKLRIASLNIEETFNVWVDEQENRRLFDYDEGSHRNIIVDGVIYNFFHITTDNVENKKVCFKSENEFDHDILPFPDDFEFKGYIIYDTQIYREWATSELFSYLNIKKRLITYQNNGYDIPVELEIDGYLTMLGSTHQELYIFSYENFTVHGCLPRDLFYMPLFQGNCSSEFPSEENVVLRERYKSSKKNILNQLINLKKTYQYLMEKRINSRKQIFNISKLNELLATKLMVDFHNRKNYTYVLKNDIFNGIKHKVKNIYSYVKESDLNLFRNYSLVGRFPLIYSWNDTIQFPFKYTKKIIQAASKKLAPAKSLDWRQKVFRAPRVKSQLLCGSCWAFATTNIFEWHGLIYHNKSEILSEQSLIDCTYSLNKGCYGGSFVSSYFWAAKYGGIPNTESYGKNGITSRKCKIKSKKYQRPFKSIMAAIGLEFATIEEMKIFIELFGPVAVIIHANTFKFGLYAGGLYEDDDCSSNINRADHTITIVGFDVDEFGNEYWIGQNSWSSRWGENGYIRISFKRNTCGVLNFGAIPVFEL